MNIKTERETLLNAFTNRFGKGGDIRVALAPGRSNLIGEHTDYNAGLVMPMAVDRHTAVVFRPAPESGPNRITVYSSVFDSTDEFELRDISRLRDPKLQWANYVRGMAQALKNRGVKLKGGQLIVTGDLPRGAGLSSSASLETAVGLALLALAGKKMDPQKLAFAAQEAEHTFAGVRCGIMDQTVVGRAEKGHALMLDCNSIEVTQVPIALKDHSFAIFDTGVKHQLGASEYNKRRAECEHAAALMKRPHLRQATLSDLLAVGTKLTTNEHKRVRHVVTENLRVAQFAAALSRGDVAELGRLLRASHNSLAVDYEVSCAELDEVVEQLMKKNAQSGGCPGARMTGGGFGGAVVALVKTEMFADYQKALAPFAKGGSMLLTPVGGAVVSKL